MGKRSYFTAYIWFHPATQPINEFFGTKNPNQDVSINSSYAFEFNHVFNKRSAVSLLFQYSSLGLGLPDDTYTYGYKGKNDFPGRVKVKGFSIGYKLFARQRYAPVGSYIKIDWTYYINKISYETQGAYELNYNNSSGGNTQIPLTYAPGEFENAGFGPAFSVGRQRIFYDKLIVDYGFRFALAIVPREGGTNAYAKQFASTAVERVFFNQFINFRLGIGFLAF